MTGRTYLLNDSGLVAMNEAAHDSEDLLQGLLAKHPDLLAGDQINSDEPRRWLLVTREMAVPGEEDGAGRWSIDHQRPHRLLLLHPPCPVPSRAEAGA